MKWPDWADFPGPGSHIWDSVSVIVQNCIGLRFTGSGVTLVDRDDGTCEVQIAGGGGGSQTLADTLALGNDANGLGIVNLLDPVDDQDAATKKYVDDSSGGGGGAWPDAAGFTATVAPVTVTDDTDTYGVPVLSGVTGGFTLGEDASIIAGPGMDGLYKVTATPTGWNKGAAPITDFFWEFYDEVATGTGFFSEYTPPGATLDPVVGYVYVAAGSAFLIDFQSTGNASPGYQFGVTLVFTRVARLAGPAGDDGQVLVKVGASVSGDVGDIIDETVKFAPLASLFPDAGAAGDVWTAGNTSPSNGEWVALPVPVTPINGRGFNTSTPAVNITDGSQHAVATIDSASGAPGTWSAAAGVLSWDEPSTPPADGSLAAGVYVAELVLTIDDNGSVAKPTVLEVDPGLGGGASPGSLPRQVALAFASGEIVVVVTMMFGLAAVDGVNPVTFTPLVTFYGGTSPNLNVTVKQITVARVSVGGV